MRTITIEEHFLAEGYRQLMQKMPLGQEKFPSVVMDGEVQKRLANLDALRLHDMDAAGIDLQVISLTASLYSPGGREEIPLVRAANDQLAAAVSAHPDRFAGFAALPMTEPEVAVDELARTVQQLGFKGAMINGTARGRFLDDPAFFPILEQAVKLDVPIYIHPAPPTEAVREAYYSGLADGLGGGLGTSGWGWHSEVGIHSLRLILAGVFDRLPKLQIIIGHMGEMIPFMLARVDDVLTPAATNLQHPISHYFLENFYITTSGFFTDPPLLLALQVVGADRIMYSVDYPFSTNEQGCAFLDHAPISPADKEKISHLNAERALKLPRS